MFCLSIRPGGWEVGAVSPPGASVEAASGAGVGPHFISEFQSPGLTGGVRDRGDAVEGEADGKSSSLADLMGRSRSPGADPVAWSLSCECEGSGSAFAYQRKHAVSKPSESRREGRKQTPEPGDARPLPREDARLAFRDTGKRARRGATLLLSFCPFSSLLASLASRLWLSQASPPKSRSGVSTLPGHPPGPRLSSPEASLLATGLPPGG